MTSEALELQLQGSTRAREKRVVENPEHRAILSIKDDLLDLPMRKLRLGEIEDLPRGLRCRWRVFSASV